MSFLENKYTKCYYRIISKAKTFDRKRNDGNYYENHHIIPACMGGTRKKNNMVMLTIKEHYVCHKLLTKMVDKSTPDYYKMLRALSMFASNSFSHSDNRKFNSIQYEEMRKANYDSQMILIQDINYRKKISKTLKEGFSSGRINKKPKTKIEKEKIVYLTKEEVNIVKENLKNPTQQRWNKGLKAIVGQPSPWKRGEILTQEDYDKKLKQARQGNAGNKYRTEESKRKQSESVKNRIAKEKELGIYIPPALNSKRQEKISCEHCDDMVTLKMYNKHHGEKCRFYDPGTQ